MKSRNSTSVLSFVLAAVLFAATTASMAFADSYTEALSINSVGYALSCAGCSAPFVDLTVTLISSTEASIGFTGLSNADYQYLMGDDSQALGINVAASSFTVTNVSSTDLAGFSPITYHGAQNVETGLDDSGDFNLILYGSGSGFSTASESISFDVNDTGGTWTSASQVLTSAGNNEGYDAAVEVYACTLSGGSCTTSDETAHGVVDASPIPTPEPRSLFLLGGGMLAMALMMRRSLLA